ncbi:flagellar basal body L-ring protein FlgH [Roseateles koreensis]|uniref:Flagellar L-ring protein n=1 Tax=Roseateles koreensis TaxID=2987526 RepID=A0ABT5KLR7_9BURK|nr:flagellar basal body L-ring protein FlgH [Roseateles koreensis]MDC8783858.1 flagellar basal body L-ring protein FlgH [Roseateles koreensis]
MQTLHQSASTPRQNRSLATLGLLLLTGLSTLCGCASAPTTITRGPLTAAPAMTPTYVEAQVTGGIYRPGMATDSLFSAERRPRNVGDTLKVDISEILSASSKLSTDNSRANALTSKGPGSNSNSLGSVLKGLMNMDVSASGTDSFKGSGNTENNSKLTGRLAASVVNVLSNGHLVVGGERSIAFNNGVSTMRFSGVVDPRDVKAGNVVQSGDVVDARLEIVGQGDVSETASRSWLQRLLTHQLTVW